MGSQRVFGKKTLLGLVVASTVLACSPSSETTSDLPSQTIEPERLKLYVFNCGDFQFPSVQAFGINDDETPVRELVVPCYIIDHPDGTLLWDGGLPSAVADQPGWQTDQQSGVKTRLQQTLQDQLETLGLGFDLASID